jgi:hypothetical protein
MFSASLEAACGTHCLIVDEIKQSILDWAVPLKEAKPVLFGLGYTEVEVSDAIRELREAAPTERFKVLFEDQFGVVPEFDEQVNGVDLGDKVEAQYI